MGVVEGFYGDPKGIRGLQGFYRRFFRRFYKTCIGVARDFVGVIQGLQIRLDLGCKQE